MKIKEKHKKTIERLVGKCPYCEKKPKLVRFRRYGYPYWFDYGPIYVCKSCDAYVGCHNDTIIPLGHLANAELREIRKQAHALFDPIWKSEEMTRTKAYLRMSDILGIEMKDAHISQLSKEQLIKLIRCLMLRKEKE